MPHLLDNHTVLYGDNTDWPPTLSCLPSIHNIFQISGDYIDMSCRTSNSIVEIPWNSSETPLPSKRTIWFLLFFLLSLVLYEVLRTSMSMRVSRRCTPLCKWIHFLGHGFRNPELWFQLSLLAVVGVIRGHYFGTSSLCKELTSVYISCFIATLVSLNCMATGKVWVRYLGSSRYTFCVCTCIITCIVLSSICYTAVTKNFWHSPRKSARGKPYDSGVLPLYACGISRLFWTPVCSFQYVRAHQRGLVKQAEVAFVLRALLLLLIDPAEIIVCSYLFQLLTIDTVDPGLRAFVVTAHKQHQ